MQVFYTDQFVLPLPDGHRFPMRRYSLLRETLQEREIVPREQFHVPAAATDDQLRLVHTAAYVERVRTGTLSEDEQRRIGFPWSPQMVERSRRSVGATISAGRAALDERVAVNLAGGTHHAFTDRGSGYCVFNDVAVAIRVLQSEQRIRRCVVIDLDVHHGDGTAAIFADAPEVFTVSLFARKAFPSRKPPGSLDVPLEPGTGDAEYHAALDATLRVVGAEARFDILFYLAGADPFEKDLLGGLALTKEGLAERDRRVFQFARRQGLPVAISMAGGYARDVRDIVDIQARTVELAREILDPETPAAPGVR